MAALVAAIHGLILHGEHSPDRPVRRIVQPNGRVRYWGLIRDLGAYLSVITLADGETVHTYYVDEDFRP